MTAFLQNRIKGSVEDHNYMKWLKLIFFADRYHIRNYGTLMTFDKYVAIPLGPVPSEGKDILNHDAFYYQNILLPEDREYLSEVIRKRGYDVEIFESTGTLSESTIEAIDFAVDHFGRFDQYELAEITHDYPEWKKYEYLIKSGESRCNDMQLIDFFKNPDMSISTFINKYLEKDPYEDDLEYLALRKEDFLGTCL